MYLMAIERVENANITSVTCPDAESGFSPLMQLVLEAHLDKRFRTVRLLGVLVRISPTTPRTSTLRLNVFLLRMDWVLVSSTVCNLLLLLTAR